MTAFERALSDRLKAALVMARARRDYWEAESSSSRVREVTAARALCTALDAVYDAVNEAIDEANESAEP